jgi:cell division protein FtsL
VRARRGTPAFWVLTALIITALVVGIVSLSALAVQGSFRSDDLSERLGVLVQQQQVLREQVAAASAPSRVMRWARSEGMVMPDRVVILRIPSAGPGSHG